MPLLPWKLTCSAEKFPADAMMVLNSTHSLLFTVYASQTMEKSCNLQQRVIGEFTNVNANCGVDESSWEITEGKKHKNCIKSMKLNRYCCKRRSVVEASASNLILITSRNNQLSGEITATIVSGRSCWQSSIIISFQQDFAESAHRKCSQSRDVANQRMFIGKTTANGVSWQSKLWIFATG